MRQRLTPDDIGKLLDGHQSTVAVQYAALSLLLDIREAAEETARNTRARLTKAQRESLEREP